MTYIVKKYIPETIKSEWNAYITIEFIPSKFAKWFGAKNKLRHFRGSCTIWLEIIGENLEMCTVSECDLLWLVQKNERYKRELNE